MEFRYRYVGFGTRFSTAPAENHRTSPELNPGVLHANEIAVDVGGCCWGVDGEQSAILDHHFHRPSGQFPSAAAAVMHHAAMIHQRFHAQPVVWLVSHRDPDFDALCAQYLTRQILTGGGGVAHDGWAHCGLRPDGWFGGREEIDWYAPAIQGLPAERRWPILLAAYASRTDASRRLSCPRQRALHAILYAAMHRGRDLISNGAWSFFEEARRAIVERGLNPLFDSLFENSREFEPELALLDRETHAYTRDIARARRCVVCLQSSPVDAWYGQAVRWPLLQPDGTLDRRHLTCGREILQQADGIFLRDPECILFKEWARADIENSFNHQGFLFTAIAYSGQRHKTAASASQNRTEYFFSLDPERAGNCHLYNLWAHLQSREALAVRRTPLKAPGAARPRPSFEERAGNFTAEFADPWFDGGNYHCSIVVTPNEGTRIGPAGIRADLSDDPIALIARDALELAVFDSEIHIHDIAASTLDTQHTSGRTLHPQDVRESLSPVATAHYRFASAAVSDDINIQNPAMALQIGQFLWRTLNPDATMDLPADFITRHLLVGNTSIGVWCREGIAIAYKSHGRHNAEESGVLLRSLIVLASKTEEAFKLPQEHRLAALDVNLREALRLKQRLALPEFRILGRFYEASRLEEVLSASHHLDRAEGEQRRSVEMNRALGELEATQKKVEWVEVFLIAVYATELLRAVIESFEKGDPATGWWVLGLAVLAMIAAILAFNIGPELKHIFHRENRRRFIGIAVWVLTFIAFLLISMPHHAPAGNSDEKSATTATQTAPATPH